MAKLITVAGRTLTQSEPSHGGLTYTITEVDVQAAKTNGNGNPVLIKQIDLSCKCKGDYEAGTSTFIGEGSASIVANTPGITCENESILLEGDNVEIVCEGTITYTSGSPSSAPGTASVKVTITNTNQTNIFVGC
jgi:hypothetical protein